MFNKVLGPLREWHYDSKWCWLCPFVAESVPVGFEPCLCLLLGLLLGGRGQDECPSRCSDLHLTGGGGGERIAAVVLPLTLS